MKKIGIVTWCKWNDNYGTILQAYALFTYIKAVGYMPQILDDAHISSSYARQKYGKIRSIDIYRKFLKKLRESMFSSDIFEKNCAKRELFNSFLKRKLIHYYRQGIDYDHLSSIEKHFDAFICGSDQIWTPDINFFDPYYFLSFVTKKPQIAYAPSIGRSSYPEELIPEIKNMLKDFKHISIREKSAANYLSEAIGRDVTACVDPTLLLDADRWIHDFKITAQEKRGDYVLFYFLGQGRWYKKTTVDYCRNKGLKTMVLPMRKEDAELGDMMSYPDMSGFLSLIYNAHYIITDSFHGMMFSIIFRKQFMICARFNDGDTISQNSRIEDFCSRINLTGRYVKSPDEIDTVFKSHLDYHTISDKLDSEINSSKDYLRVALKEI